MPNDSANMRAMRALGVSVLAVFLFGLTSGPLRTCVSHPGHASDQHESQVATEHGASHHPMPATDRAPDAEHEGCSCLGHCSVETAPYAPRAGVPVLAQTPDAPRDLSPVVDQVLTKRDQFRLPLARPPPAVV
ncbi:MAG: hypothetical protein OEO79_14660 [Gemmatimonadota bacterium]|nr:hypothetical protein [Gemmatimonadota bacterium]